jgi:hypothetical protein
VVQQLQQALLVFWRLLVLHSRAGNPGPRLLLRQMLLLLHQ